MMLSKQNYQPPLSDMIITSLICPQLLLDVMTESQAAQHLLMIHAGLDTDLDSQDTKIHLLLLGPTFGAFIPSKKRRVGIFVIL